MLRLQCNPRLLAFVLVLGGFASVNVGSITAAHTHDAHCPQCREYQYGNPDLFYNFFAPPTCGGITAGIYPAPLPVPAHVGHVYYTYQPLMPHEFLYKHHRSYHRSYDGGRGLTRTSVHWW